jgi:hypothetical protein
MAVNVSSVFFWALTFCKLEGGYQYPQIKYRLLALYPEDGSDTFLRNILTTHKIVIKNNVKVQ